MGFRVACFIVSDFLGPGYFSSMGHEGFSSNTFNLVVESID